MTQDIIFTRERHLGIITLARPQALHALTLPMIKAFYKQLREWEKDSSIHAVWLQAEPGKAFCAGGDVRWVYSHGPQHITEVFDFFWHEYRLNEAIYNFSKPYIAVMNGITMGGGVGISLHGSYPVATERFVFAMPETGIGLFPDIGASYWLSRCPGEIGLYLALTGATLSSYDAKQLGLIKYVIPEESLKDVLVNCIAADLSKEPFEAVHQCLQTVCIADSLTGTLTNEHMEVINQCFVLPTMETIIEALQTSQSAFGAEVARILLQRAPLSLKVTLVQIRRARTLTLAQCLAMDAILVRHFVQAADFYEGVRALLIDKDKNPRWQPSELALVTEEMVLACFREGTE